MLARRFLGCVFVLTLIAVVLGFAYFQFADRAIVSMATPKGHFQPMKAGAGPDYANTTNWVSRPGQSAVADWRPEGFEEAATPHIAATFFVHPTTYLQTDRWNAPLMPGGDTESRTNIFVRSQASVFNGISDIWAPRYRQAAFGAFLLRSADAQKALDFAYADVLSAFDKFLAEQPARRPLILAAHSQGSLHLLRLLAERRSVIGSRLIAAYVVGWPVGVTADLPATGLSACAGADDVGCVLSWQSFGQPANPRLVTDAWVGTRGLTGKSRATADLLCVNPISGERGGSAPASANLGTLHPNSAFTSASLRPGEVGARCEGGFLLVDGQLPSLGPFALPGNNLHPFDYALFWGSLRRDAERRAAAFRAKAR
jgi:hypothetical protein